VHSWTRSFIGAGYRAVFDACGSVKVTAPWNQADSGKIIGSAQGSSTTAIARRLPPTWRRAFLCLHNRIFLEADNIILKLKDFFSVVQVNPGAEFSLEKGCSW
jgi:hypothetical protein